MHSQARLTSLLVLLMSTTAYAQPAEDGYLRFPITSDPTLLNPLLNDGYPSIGCAPCTRRVAPGEDPRAGRWAGLDKSECGLHT